ncbi:hypothetical protein HYH03_016661 [Edaphochlamys debaryana]|uniref:Ankyrin repeat domain-containing protein n=1 Tax=Edaphochlamys debaryana TaxID=47281 RepID=A0A835XLN5_9CHLO|nr:hypothetical protein HYH03_016661 [Edaphochlamys debaryana]|eukprot:KAG2484521.1 hypothetical protein HYH03_016661 [Edaphochlamys debaryana]
MGDSDDTGSWYSADEALDEETLEDVMAKGEPASSGPGADVQLGQRWALHRAAWAGQVEAVQKLAQGMSREQFKELDGQGNTALHVAVMRRQAGAARALLEAGCPAGPRNARGWVPLMEAVELGDRPLALSLAKAEVEQMKVAVRHKKAALMALLRSDLPDFSLQLKWELGSGMPGVGALVRRYAPHDTYTLWKKGGLIRVDGTLMGVDEDGQSMMPNWKRGHFSLLYDATGDKGRAMFVNHGKKTFVDVKAARKKLGVEDPDAVLGTHPPIHTHAPPTPLRPHPPAARKKLGVEDPDAVLAQEVDMLLCSEVLQHKKLKSVDFRFKPVAGWLTKEVREKVEGWNCKLYEAAGRLIAISRYKMPYGLTPAMSYDDYLAAAFEPDPTVESPVNPLNPASLKDKGMNPQKAAAKAAVAAKHQGIARAAANARDDAAAAVATAAAARAAAGAMRALAPRLDEEEEEEEEEGEEEGEEGEGEGEEGGSSRGRRGGGGQKGASVKLKGRASSKGRAGKEGRAAETEGGGGGGRTLVLAEAEAGPGAGADSQLTTGAGAVVASVDPLAGDDLTAWAERVAAEASAAKAQAGGPGADEDDDGEGEGEAGAGTSGRHAGTGGGAAKRGGGSGPRPAAGGRSSKSSIGGSGAGAAGSGTGSGSAGGGKSWKGMLGFGSGSKKAAKQAHPDPQPQAQPGPGPTAPGGPSSTTAAGVGAAGEAGGAAAKKSRRITGRCWMAESFPLSLHQLLPLLEVVGSANKAFAKVARFLRKYGELDMFPVKVQVPLLLTVYMMLTFKEFRLLGPGPGQAAVPDDSFFAVPPGYEEAKVDESSHGKPSLAARFGRTSTANSTASGPPATPRGTGASTSQPSPSPSARSGPDAGGDAASAAAPGTPAADEEERAASFMAGGKHKGKGKGKGKGRAGDGDGPKLTLLRGAMEEDDMGFGADD